MKKYIMFILFGLLFITAGILMEKYEVLHGNLQEICTFFSGSKETKSETGIDVKFPELDLKELLSIAPDNIDSMKTELNSAIFGTTNIPRSLPDTVFHINDNNYIDIKNLKKIEQFEVVQKHGILSKGYIFRPKNSNNRLILYHQGHRGDFIKGKETIKFFVDKGFTIYAFCMPLLGKNNKPVVMKGKFGAIHLTSHEKLKYLDNPIQYFITPVISMINYSEKENFKDITMIGISGGGWTTTVAAATDNRINFSFPVAGTYPMFIRFQTAVKNYGDFEQSYVPLYSRVNYLDMYVMGSVGCERYQVQVLNKYDPCCFDGEEYLKYESFISSNVDLFDEGNFTVILDTTHQEHKISELIHLKILDKLKGD